MGLAEFIGFLFNGVSGEWKYRNACNGRHRFVVNCVMQNGTPCGFEVLAYSSGQAKDSVRGRADIKYITNVEEIH